MGAQDIKIGGDLSIEHKTRGWERRFEGLDSVDWYGPSWA